MVECAPGKFATRLVSIPRDDVLDSLTEGYYFGVGGFGDALMLLSTFYDNHPGSSLVFWASTTHWKSVYDFLRMFPNLHRIIVTLLPEDRLTFYRRLIFHKNFRGKGHLADNLDYILEWGVSAEKYRQNIPLRWPTLRKLWPGNSDHMGNYVGVACWGAGTTDILGKNRRLTQPEFESLLRALLNKHPDKIIRVFGSAKDRVDFPIPLSLFKIGFNLPIGLGVQRIEDCRGISWPALFTALNELSEMISVDTWFIQWTRFVNIPTTVIKTRYQYPLRAIIGVPFDPSDKIFIEGWGFAVMSLSELLTS